MTREQFYTWLATCPAKEETDETDENGEWKLTLRSGYRIIDDFGEVKVHFWFEEEEQVAVFDKDGKLVGNYKNMKQAQDLKPEEDGHKYVKH